MSLRKSAEAKFEVIQELQDKGLLCLDGDFVPSVHYPPITQYPPVTQEYTFKKVTEICTHVNYKNKPFRNR